MTVTVALAMASPSRALSEAVVAALSARDPLAGPILAELTSHHVEPYIIHI